LKWLCVLSLLCACETTRPCRTQTLLVTVALDATSVPADRVDIDVTIDGTPSKTNSFNHTPGDLQGTIEIDFPSGYPAGHTIDLTVRADQAGTTIGNGSGELVLGDDCSTITIPVPGGP
jgi:hypothetical protein